MRIVKLHNPKDYKNFFKSVIRSLDVENTLSDYTVDHYADLFIDLLNDEEIITSDEVFQETIGILFKCLHKIDDNTARLICNGHLSLLKCEFED